ncbi:hypothetical protein Rsub_04340 [Raphidocelis subcapitata]|uniref:Uncharacterized protein n=1 Tax=Raphidocelis subcapitata TaxID=307507 RepID=A0A2V0P189_9CHLO|nr:hypothetical protein Rsub_04340 [Raphidocelis subcapitata]|eukprot:GBF91600.1 hypothetical protein Rsub_04340 [Raphidocelis subcapitata]
MRSPSVAKLAEQHGGEAGTAGVAGCCAVPAHTTHDAGAAPQAASAAAPAAPGKQDRPVGMTPVEAAAVGMAAPPPTPGGGRPPLQPAAAKRPQPSLLLAADGPGQQSGRPAADGDESVRQPSTPAETERCAPPQAGSGASSPASASASASGSASGAEQSAAAGGRAASPDAAALSSPSSAAPRGGGAAARAAPRPAMARAPHLQPSPRPAAHAARGTPNPVSAGIVGTFFPVERPRPPPAGDQVNFAQRIMEICFAGATQWPMNLKLQFVVDGAARGAAVEVTVGRSICKSQVSGSRQVIYYVRNPALLRLARSFDARTVGYRLAGPTTLEWHLSTAPTPPAPAAAAKAPVGRRKSASGGGGKGSGGGGGGGGGGGDWLAAAGAAQLSQQVALLQQLGGALGLGFGGAGAGGDGGDDLQQQLSCAPPALLTQLQQWLSQPQLLAGAAGGASPAALAAAIAAAAAAAAACGPDPSTLRTKRRKQTHPLRAPFYGLQQPGVAAVCHVLPCLAAARQYGDAGCSGSGSGSGSDGERGRQAGG